MQPSTLDPRLHLVLASDENGVEGLAVAVYTALEQSSLPVRLWVIADGISANTQERLHALWQPTGKLETLEFVPPPRLPAWWAAHNYPLIGYARIEIDRILPASVARCVYIDIDVLVGADLAELVAQPMHGCPLGMVRNTGLSPEGVRYVESIGTTADTYYNAGVMLMDLKAWRAEGARERLIRRRGELPVDLSCHDQDLLNIYFAGRILPLEERWNLRDAGASPKDNVLHFAGGRKPWTYLTPPDSSQTYPSQDFVDQEEMPSGVRAWQDARVRAGHVQQQITSQRRALRTLKSLRARAERLLRRRF